MKTVVHKQKKIFHQKTSLSTPNQPKPNKFSAKETLSRVDSHSDFKSSFKRKDSFKSFLFKKYSNVSQKNQLLIDIPKFATSTNNLQKTKPFNTPVSYKVRITSEFLFKKNSLCDFKSNKLKLASTGQHLFAFPGAKLLKYPKLSCKKPVALNNKGPFLDEYDYFNELPKNETSKQYTPRSSNIFRVISKECLLRRSVDGASRKSSNSINKGLIQLKEKIYAKLVLKQR